VITLGAELIQITNVRISVVHIHILILSLNRTEEDLVLVSVVMDSAAVSSPVICLYI
jgi:hypothetical protein